jgi:hypothetical protein
MWREGTLPNKESEPTGNVLHNALTDYGMNSPNNAALTDRLAKEGIPGIKYLDQGSRNSPSRIAAQERHIAYLERTAAPDVKLTEAKQHLESLKGEGSRNYVVFNDKLVDIIKKYGMAGISMLPPAMAAAVSKHVKPVDHDPFNQGT